MNHISVSIPDSIHLLMRRLCEIQDYVSAAYFKLKGKGDRLIDFNAKYTHLELFYT